MKTYLEVLDLVLNEGNLKSNRTGIDTLSYFAYPFRHNLSNGFPLLTTKKMDGTLWNSLVHELLWFISGENNIRNLQQHTKIWNSWADENGDLATAYGFYWRNFPYAFNGNMIVEEQVGQIDWLAISDTEMGVGHFDQLKYCIEQLKSNPNSRRLVVSAWEPYNAHKSKLPPCHLLYVFNVQNDKLCLHMTQRSCDLFLGVPFNIASYALLTHIVAKEVGLKPGILSIMFVDCHLYCADIDDQTIVNGKPRCDYDHTRLAAQQLLKKPYPLCQLKINGDNAWNKHRFEDFELVNYRCHGRLKANVAV